MLNEKIYIIKNICDNRNIKYEFNEEQKFITISADSFTDATLDKASFYEYVFKMGGDTRHLISISSDMVTVKQLTDII